MNVFRDGPSLPRVEFDLPVRELALTRKPEPLPFVPSGTGAQEHRCEEVLTIQAAGLEQRLRVTRKPCCHRPIGRPGLRPGPAGDLPRL